MQWLNEPSEWRADGDRILITTDADTDFWRKTHYGFEADNGHLYYSEVSGDCSVAVRVRFHPVHQYDQAGLMLRISPECWVKTSVEHEIHGPAKLGVVVTNQGYSDWSIQDYTGPNEIWLRIRRVGSDCFVEHSGDGVSWREMRVAHLHTSSLQAACGIYACSPRGAGFRAKFDKLSIG